ncbi:PI-PLC X domain-containing protein 1-like [Nerophis ophidion]|uniref:PI-PLC X domain-containing protein 1-like n=1 Tax=Nerophis ophidion TaxID=159077 RepID=UPI002AE00CD2|nr:PI-PLC X domain-containing protein 1-like [Nerophis ophidion]XP_061744570.1 PI-PLC X domain-containing protein 1-like [Nerophis ophidion]XP_061744571.1 PI-PLC X domain-containing protein 1-like [Nerophis ophidion]XP_061744905.1 PI-PLC X domain-containing protein 1-like [Nerophis ophidion]XP_061744906.1 PI-PLC X domain-containing protein 1-like [Nerophis ophidion]
MDLRCRDWMAALPEELWDVPLNYLAIPGSHDTMSYCLDINSPLVRSESDIFRILDGLCCCFTRPTIYKWATTQDRCIEDQLSMGIRYFDLRVARKPSEPGSHLHFTHILYTHLTVLETLASMASWLDAHPKEVVILACRHFEGMDDQIHESFISALQHLFGTKLCPRQEPELTLRALWASGRQVLLSYDADVASRHAQLLPAIPYWWANQGTARGAIRYLEWQQQLGRPEGFFVAGLNLTANRKYILTNPKQSLRTLTWAQWEHLSKWLQDQRPGSDRRSLNIIAADFVGPLPLCSLVIGLNRKLLTRYNSD